LIYCSPNAVNTSFSVLIFSTNINFDPFLWWITWSRFSSLLL
jgi:hypothetical protein